EGEAPPRRVFDPSERGPRAALDYFFPSPDGARVALGISHGGDEQSALHVLELSTGRLEDTRIPGARWASVAWEPDGGGFYYTPDPGPEGTRRLVRYHRLGSDAAEDPEVYARPGTADFLQVSLDDA